MRDDALTFTNYACAAQRFTVCFPDAGRIPSAALNLIMDYCDPQWRPNSLDEVRRQFRRARNLALRDSKRGAVVFIDEKDAEIVTHHIRELLDYVEGLYSTWGIDCDFFQMQSKPSE
jgi:hypothetical protein